MAHVRKLSVHGTRSDHEEDHNILALSRQWNSSIDSDMLKDPDILEYLLSRGFKVTARTSNNFADYICGREVGLERIQHMKVSRTYGTKHLLQNDLLVEKEIKLGRLNKVFCSTFLSDRQIAFGTKCNKLMVLDIKTKKLYHIPSLKSASTSIPPENPCGIHALQVNPSHSLLVTSGQNTNDTAVYKLPTLDPLCVGEGAHKDWIFDLVWLDDEYFVSGSRDTTIGLWRIPQHTAVAPNRSIPNIHHMRPVTVRKCKNAEKVRALLFNEHNQELVALSLNAYVHQWDVKRFKWKASQKLPYSEENVCLAQQPARNIYAVGSKSYVTFLDSSTLKPTQKVPSKYLNCGIRSLSFCDDLLTIGTGTGILLFFDVRASKYLELTNPGRRKFAALLVREGWVKTDDIFREVFWNTDYSPAIYTHCYDSSGLKLFTAGGPLAASIEGNYAGLWE